MARYRQADFLNELRCGHYHGVFIDDTGSPGLPTGSTHLHPDRKSFVAVIVSAADIGEVLREMPGAIQELTLACGATEFHFADIYNGRGQFKNLDLNLRLAFFRLMSHIFQVYKFPIIVQTFNPITLQEVHRRADLQVKRIGPFNLEKQEDLALFFLLLRIKLHLEKEFPNGSQARVFVDEGFKKNGVAIKMPRFARYFADGLVCFARSDTILPIQLADFAAFALNRHQILLSKPLLSDLDRELLAILTPMAWNYQNIQQIRLPLRIKDETNRR
jgi:Protein of unknown function (DUF3800)